MVRDYRFVVFVWNKVFWIIKYFYKVARVIIVSPRKQRQAIAEFVCFYVIT